MNLLKLWMVTNYMVYHYFKALNKKGRAFILLYQNITNLTDIATINVQKNLS